MAQSWCSLSSPIINCCVFNLIGFRSRLSSLHSSASSFLLQKKRTTGRAGQAHGVKRCSGLLACGGDTGAKNSPACVAANRVGHARVLLPLEAHNRIALANAQLVAARAAHDQAEPKPANALLCWCEKETKTFMSISCSLSLSLSLSLSCIHHGT